MRKENVLLLIVSFLICMNTVSAEPTKLYVDPSSIEDLNLGVDDTFSVDINIDDVTDMAGWQFKINFNPDILSVSNIEKGPFPSGCSFVNPTIKNGNALAGCYFVGDSESGSGTLATITFQILGIGESNLDFNLDETFLLKLNVEKISYQKDDGYFRNSPITTTETTAPMTSGSTSSSSGSTKETQKEEEATTSVRVTTTKITTTVSCEEKWTCTEWSECKNELQSRTCTDENECGTFKNKPEESQICKTSRIPTGWTITGLFETTTVIAMVLILLVMIIFIIKMLRIKTKGRMPE